ncbi:MAG: hypothetical protein QXF25_00315 [Candidatus Pacearchaeota archaeon]
MKKEKFSIDGLEIGFKKEVNSKNLLKYVIAIVIVIMFIVGAVLIFKSKEESAVPEVSKPSEEDILMEIGEFKINWRSFVGFECGKNSLLSIAANTYEGLKNIKIPENAYLNCWYKVGSYIKDDLLADDFSVLIGSFNPKKGYNIELCCQAIDFVSGKAISKEHCKTKYLEPMCK